MIDKIEKIRNDKNFDSNKIYLIEKVNQGGFFFSDGKLFYSVSSKENKNKNIKTNVLTLQTNIHITSVANNNSFLSGFYDMIIYNEEIDSYQFTIFENLCRLISKKKNIDIVSYFFMLVEMFSLANEDSKLNVCGLFGELYFIYNCYVFLGKSVHKNWHTNETNDVSDFQFSDFQIEIKTSTSIDGKFKLKYDQLIRPNNCYLALISVHRDTPEGKSLRELINDILKIELFANDIDFLIKIEIERSKINSWDEETKFFVWRQNLYHINDLRLFSGVPSNITNIQFDYTISNEKETSLNEVLN